MDIATTGPVAPPEVLTTSRRKQRGVLVRFARSSPAGAVAAVFLLLLLFVAIFADVLAPYDPLLQDYTATRQPPSAEHLMGTDILGRDILSRIIHGARVSLFVALVAVFIGDAIGLIWGTITGYVGGRFDLFNQRALDSLMAFPGLILAMLLLVGLGPGLTTVIVAIAVTRIPLSTRVIRSVVLSTREFAFVEAARSIGSPESRIMFRHITPHCIAPFLIITTASIGVAITTEAALSFLGVGIPPPTPTWGNMLGGILAESFRPRWWMIV
jgi:ABC-type dipeptide/oligopeptide/nickel transport system permease subunit